MSDNITLSEKTKQYLYKKLSDCEKKLNQTKRRRTIIATIYTIIIVSSIVTSALVASLALPPTAVTILSISSAVLTGLSSRFNFQAKSHKIKDLIRTLNQIQLKLDYVVSCNGNFTEEEYQKIMEQFNH